MKTNHTPGHWAISKHATPDYAPQFGVYSDDSSKDLAIIKGDNANADAALVAAAPDLLAALQAVEARLTKAAEAFYVSGKQKDLQAAFDGWKVDARQARDAIYKANPQI